MQAQTLSSSFHRNATSSPIKLESWFTSPPPVSQLGVRRDGGGGRPGRAQTPPQLRCAEQPRKKPGLQSLPGAVYGEDRDLDSSKSENYLLSLTGSFSFSLFFFSISTAIHQLLEVLYSYMILEQM